MPVLNRRLQRQSHVSYLVRNNLQGEGRTEQEQLLATAAERERDNLKYFKSFCLKNGSSGGNNLALTVLFAPNSLDSGSSTISKHAFVERVNHTGEYDPFV